MVLLLKMIYAPDLKMDYMLMKNIVTIITGATKTCQISQYWKSVQMVWLLLALKEACKEIVITLSE